MTTSDERIFGFNQEVRVEGIADVFKRPIHNFSLNVTEIAVYDGCKTGEGPWNFKVGSLWRKDWGVLRMKAACR